MVEFPMQGGGRLDTRPVAPMCKVQIKGTRKDARSVDIKLDNMERMAKELVPWFIVVFSFGAGDKVENVYVIHVGKDLIARALERLLEHSPDDELHEKTLTVACEASDCLTASPTPELMVERMHTHLGGASEDYLTQKSIWIRDAGYAEARYSFRVETSAETAEEDLEMMSDLAVGARQSVPLSAFSLYEIRFDKEILVKSLGEEGGLQLELAEPRSSGVTKVTIESEGESATLVCETYLSAWLPDLPKELLKARFVSALATLEIKFGIGSVRWHLDLKTGVKARLIDLGTIGRVIRLMARHHWVRLSFQSKKGNIEHSFEVPASSEETFPEVVIRLGSAAESALWVANNFSFDTTIELDPSDLLEQASRIAALRGLLDREAKILTIKSTMDHADELDGELAAIVGCPGVLLGDCVLLACVAVIGILRRSDDNRSVAMERPERVLIVGKKAVQRTKWEGAPSVDSLMEAAIRQLEDDGIPHIITI